MLQCILPFQYRSSLGAWTGGYPGVVIPEKTTDLTVLSSFFSLRVSQSKLISDHYMLLKLLLYCSYACMTYSGTYNSGLSQNIIIRTQYNKPRYKEHDLSSYTDPNYISYNSF